MPRDGKRLDVSIDYLLVEQAPRGPLHGADFTCLERLGDMSQLTDEEKSSVLVFIDALLTKHHLQELAFGAV